MSAKSWLLTEEAENELCFVEGFAQHSLYAAAFSSGDCQVQMIACVALLDLLKTNEDLF